MPLLGQLSLADGLATQREQLDNWKPKLSPYCYAALEIEVRRQNDILRKTPGATGWDVFRGTDLSNFILNWKP